MSRDSSRRAIGFLGVLLLAPIVVAANAIFAALHAMVALAAWLLQGAATALRRAGLPPAAPAADWMRRIGVRANGDRAAAIRLVASTWAAVRGVAGDVPPRQWLSRTVLAGTARLVLLPVFAGIDLGAAIVATLPTRRWAIAAGRRLSRRLVRRSAVNRLPGEVGALSVARTHLGFCVMVLSATPQVMNNNQGILGGCLAVLLGDPDWLAQAMWQMREYADYVHEKERLGELGPRSRMPFGRGMVRTTGHIVDAYPADTVDLIRQSGFLGGARAYWRDRARVHRYLGLYFPFTGYMMMDVRTFFTRGLRDAPEAPAATLCELAIVTSALTDGDKDAALLDVQAVAPASIVEFEHYVGLVRPRDGTVAEKAIRRSASGAPLDTHTVVPSILDRHAVHVAQSTNAEVYALRTFLWLYRDEARARAVNDAEAARKFGPDVAARIRAKPLYPLESWELETLTAGGPRSRDEIDAILRDALRGRGLGHIADRVEAAAVAARAAGSGIAGGSDESPLSGTRRGDPVRNL